MPSPRKKYLFIVDALDQSDDVVNMLSKLELPKWLIPVYAIAHVHGQKRTKEKIRMFNLSRLYFDDINKEYIRRDSQEYILKRLETDTKLKSLVTKGTGVYVFYIEIIQWNSINLLQKFPFLSLLL